MTEVIIDIYKDTVITLFNKNPIFSLFTLGHIFIWKLAFICWENAFDWSEVICQMFLK